ncbi:type II toxin-antitoxin system Phd/YefM family antitoxin [uncultured Jannaschia sp.]|uniref:type II toxin-antitoxin system Phd/YefM family antitoxin n=1 Tax=uncultured Jannaschia sp. TaxID=293347 RepID=UPI002625ADDF|nr:type II toxin-antitoxin system Phd/YefM family antitoxin [uncultured Jannaschia sp.]
MPIVTVTSRELNQDLSRAKRAALAGPVFITDRGRPAHVLLSIEAYEKLVGTTQNLVEVLAMPGLSEIEFDPPKSEIASRPAELG